MSLALVQDYSSEDEEVVEVPLSPPADLNNSGDDEQADDDGQVEELQQGSRSSLLSPLDAFAEITGPPAFLKHCVNDTEQESRRGPNKPDAVVEGKAVIVASSGAASLKQEFTALSGESPRVIKPGNPSVQDATELLRMCVQCGVPKTYSQVRGMVCPVCRDYSRKEVEAEKKRSRVKDREKNKRSKGQSSHATWKSETEMHLRQQFD